ncbi:hypothetical protein LPJ61_001924 [Coemansia biformis]|uniref:GTP-binding protein n=1 Tax=Coemansia biformis TaxID=1286918 RepID=A0A9W8D058_9FUNG|nr:hypothetical protein LPJ61_001924 [Coemansia biformis]
MNGYGSSTHAGGSGTSIGMYGQGLGNTGLTTETGSDQGVAPHKDQLADRRVMFMGLPRSGKTSIIKVVLDNEQAYDTLGLLSTTQRTEHRMMPGITVYDFPGIDDYAESQYIVLNPDIYEGEHTSLVFVVDSQSDIQSAITALFSVMRTAQSVNPHIPINVFINKIDGLSEELKQDIQHDIQQRVLKNMSFENLNCDHMHFLLTTIYSESIKEAFSKVIQYLVPQHSSLEAIINSFCSKSSLDKVLLIDFSTKIYLATDSSPTYSPRYTFACKTIDVIDEISALCGSYVPVDEDDLPLQRINVALDGYEDIFIYQISPSLTLFCFGPPQIISQTSLLEFNGSKVAKAIRKLLPI